MTVILLVNALLTLGFVALFGIAAWATDRLLGPSPEPGRYRHIEEHQLADSA